MNNEEQIGTSTEQATTILPELDDYDWAEVFKAEYALPTRALGAPADLSTETFARENVKRIIAMVDGEHYGRDWVGVFELTDGRFVSISAGCDYTGWDCQAGGSSQVAATEQDIIRFGLTDDERERLNLKLPEETQ